MMIGDNEEDLAKELQALPAVGLVLANKGDLCVWYVKQPDEGGIWTTTVKKYAKRFTPEEACELLANYPKTLKGFRATSD